VCVVPDAIIYGEQAGPYITSELIVLDRFNKEQNKKYSSEIFAFFKEQLAVEYSKYVVSNLYCFRPHIISNT